MKPSAVIFDLDGTLIHTTHLYERACIEGMKSIGIDFTSEDFQYHYPRGYSMHSWIEQKGGDPARLKDVRAARDEVYHHLLSTESTYCDGAEDLLDFLRSHPTGVVTNSWRSYLDAIDRNLGIYRRLSDIVTADDMGEFCKPHPHGLLLTADRLKVDPASAMYVGDQIFDLEAARAAGMTACLVKGPHTPNGADEHADIVVNDLGELQQQLQ